MLLCLRLMFRLLLRLLLLIIIFLCLKGQVGQSSKACRQEGVRMACL